MATVARCSAVARSDGAAVRSTTRARIGRAKQNAHVVYEAVELARLLLADFDTAVSHIVSQPFLLVTSVEGKQRKHSPDHLLITNDGPVVVDVKPRRHLTKPVVVRTFA